MENKKYQPSNGTEGMFFIEKHCYNCIHGKYEHTQRCEDNPCEILTNTMLHNVNDKEYPKEWIYNEYGEPTCTAWKKWDWGRDDDGNFIEPPEMPPDNPAQLVMPFIFDELEIPKLKTHNTCEHSNSQTLKQ